ncbi:MAG TPA: hypothetical protein VFF30_18205 [Nitrososphaerales archaeon]|nr:hypothetical protein [Nitrososphaerales archaeon]
MKPLAYIYPVTAFVIFLQGITGASTVLNFYDVGSHLASGYVTGVFALADLVIAFIAKPKSIALRYSSLVLFILVVIQGMLGFAAMTSDQIVAAHFTNFLVLFGVSIATIFYAFRWGRGVGGMVEKKTAQGQTTTTTTTATA